jgi:aminoglycoside 3-N-acetyltransferase I
MALSSADVVRMHGVLDVFARAFDDAPSYDCRRPSDEYLSALLADESFIALAALKAGHVVGGLAAYVLRKFEQACSEVYIYDLAVNDGHRREGIATALIEHLRGVAAARGAWVIYVQADQGDAPAIALYSRLGTREDVLHFDISVPGAN